MGSTAASSSSSTSISSTTTTTTPSSTSTSTTSAITTTTTTTLTATLSSTSTTTTTTSSSTSTSTSTTITSTTTLTTTQSSTSTTTTSSTSTSTSISTTTTTVCSQPTWSQTATTIFGSQAGTSGSDLISLSTPVGMYYDGPNNMLTVVDDGNQRVLRFSINNSSSVATVIAGSNGLGCNMNQFYWPNGIGVDSSGRLYVADYYCNQVVRFPSNSNSTTSGTLLGSVTVAAFISINQLTNDIYVVSYSDNAIYEFVGGNGSAVVAAGGNGNGNALNQLSGPNGVYYDYLYTSSLYVTDNGNYRVMKYPSGSTSATYGTVVAGGNSVGSAANQLNNPRSVLIDSSGALYIADGSNNRIQRWLQNASSGTTVVGGTQGTATNQLNWPETVLFDKYDNLLVVDRGNNRIQLFNLTTC
ncbi:unnamed protein product [Adineta steineri]|uniref:NHL repeat containing protein n=1 Tax=Adineta steineri TaxID=433720 RepID=A0A814NQP0_9BILA|nr:unnamed protein product [Adineta steineri]